VAAEAAVAAVAAVTAVAVVMAATNYIFCRPIANRKSQYMSPQLKTTKFVICDGIFNSKGQSATRVNLFSI
jgi:hypothetical protein